MMIPFAVLQVLKVAVAFNVTLQSNRICRKSVTYDLSHTGLLIRDKYLETIGLKNAHFPTGWQVVANQLTLGVNRCQHGRDADVSVHSPNPRQIVITTMTQTVCLQSKNCIFLNVLVCRSVKNLYFEGKCLLFCITFIKFHCLRE